MYVVAVSAKKTKVPMSWLPVRLRRLGGGGGVLVDGSWVKPLVWWDVVNLLYFSWTR